MLHSAPAPERSIVTDGAPTPVMCPMTSTLLGPARASLLALTLGSCAAGEGPALVSTTDALAHTDFAATRSEPLDPGANRIWCAPIALAWGELRELSGGDLEAAAPNSTFERLNAEPFPASDLDPASYTAFAAPAGAAVVQRVRRASEDGGFGGSEAFEAAASGPGVVAYAQLTKALSFPVRFEDLERLPIEFRGMPGSRPVAVDAFGIASFDITERPHQRLREQVAIHETEDRSSFVVRLSTDQGDSVLLARVDPRGSLQSTWDAALELIDGQQAERLWVRDTLRVPELDLGLRHRFRELEGLVLSVSPFEGQAIQSAMQDLELRLDEVGMVVRSRAQFGVSSAAASGPRELVFDRPFLLAAIEEDATTPYLLAWIAHPEILKVVPTTDDVSDE